MTDIPKVASLVLEIQTRLRRAQQSVDRMGRMIESIRSVQDLEYNEEYAEEELILQSELDNIYTAKRLTYRQPH